ncbi:putative CoA-transferase subunit beta [Novosphingobium endophyticum]|uniref:CoA-transferase subunit beta n=1 Tax=Novosphingobium endophyticum TaxID=1955250 RepID=A0A916TU22_9SPHN|nr:ketoacid CoA transferase [Novosphingobium endophyticum]GGC06931.1 putative CoA-transferase subunit beta [Novosphingobium endophyticum]
MSDVTNQATLAELCILACSEAFRTSAEQVATGIGPVPRIGAGLARLTHSPGLMMTDGEAFLVEEPVPLGPRGDHQPRFAGYLPFSRFFDSAVWTGGRRHAMVTPTQIDRFGQTNLSQLGGTHRQPKTQMLGVRGFPGNSIYHANSMFIPAHSKRVFVEGEVDMVSSAGYNPAKRIAGGNYSGIDLRAIVTNLCVMDFGGPDNAIRVVSLHPGVTIDEVQEATGFALLDAVERETPLPGKDALDVIARLDPHNIRASVIRDNPPAVRAAP